MKQGNPNINQKVNVQWGVLIIGVILLLLKFLAFFITNSVSILTDALESIVNVIAGIITLKSLQYAIKPKDENHPYGHGKVELITSFVEGILIALAGLLIIIEAVKRIGTPSEVVKLDVGFYLIAFTGLVNYALGRYSILKGKKLNSIALVSGGKHLISDTYTTLILLIGLVSIHFTKIVLIDSILATFMGVYIIYIAYGVLKTAIVGLMDESDEETLNKIIAKIINHKIAEWIYMHKITYLKFGHTSHLDLHLTLPYYFTIKQANDVIFSLKMMLKEVVPEENVEISVQSEPCEKEMCKNCYFNCEKRSQPYTGEDLITNENIRKDNIFNPKK